MPRAALVAWVALTALAAASVAFALPTTSHPVSIYVLRGHGNSCARVVPLKRGVSGPQVLRGAMQALLAGPTAAERARGYGGWFSAKTGGHLRSVRLANGTAYIDFRSFKNDIPGASSSCGSTLLLAQLDRTATQFAAVERTVYSFDGSRRAFYEWLQRVTPAG
jgi:hypothetical protein